MQLHCVFSCLLTAVYNHLQQLFSHPLLLLMIAIGTVGSWTRGWWPEAGSWERWTRGGAPPAAEAHATKSHNTFSYIPAHFPF